MLGLATALGGVGFVDDMIKIRRARNLGLNKTAKTVGILTAAVLFGVLALSFRNADVFDLLSSYSSTRQRFQTIVLDPPAFTKSRVNLEDAGRGYKEINLRALRLLQPGGILVTCSCSHHLGEAALLELVAQASLDANRTLRVLERRTQSQDHPILLLQARQRDRHIRCGPAQRRVEDVRRDAHASSPFPATGEVEAA